jgi:ribosomal protein S12 methylthiotransferase accessory factor
MLLTAMIASDDAPPTDDGTPMDDRIADGAKQYLAGTHRVVDPAATLACVLPMAPRMGITRVAVLTGLDVLGIPVVAAIRPNSRSIAVHQGKGVTLAAAKASAVMEAVEIFHAETMTLNLRLAACHELAEAVDPTTLPRAAGRVLGDARILWVEAQNLMSGGRLFVPYELVTADYTHPAPAGAGLFQATTNGLASGNHWLEAVLHGLYEVVERDAIALWRAGGETARAASAMALDTVDGAVSQGLLACYRAAEVAVRVWDVTSDIGLPCFVALAVAPDAIDGVEPELGSGCHADRDIALSRALSEAAQARLTRISGARDDFAPEGYADIARAERLEMAARWLQIPGRRDFCRAPSCAGPTLRHDLDAALTRLAAAGVHQVAYVDLTRPEFGIPVARVIVPGLEGPWTPPSGDYTPGARTQAHQQKPPPEQKTLPLPLVSDRYRTEYAGGSNLPPSPTHQAEEENPPPARPNRDPHDKRVPPR